MYDIHHDARTFDKILPALLEHGEFYNTVDIDAEINDDLKCWQGKLAFVSAPIDLAVILMEASSACLLSSCGCYLIHATKELQDSRYSVELYHGSRQRIDEQYNQLLTGIRNLMLKDWQARQRSE